LHLLNTNYASIEENDTLNNLNKIVNKVLNIFENNYKYYLHKKKIKFQLIEHVNNNNTIKKWQNESMTNCKEHKMLL